MHRHVLFEHRSALAVALIVLSGGCSSRMPTEASGESRLTLHPNQPVSIEEHAVVVNLVRVENDSRCAIDVTCVTAGNAVAVFTASFGNLPVLPAMQFVNTTIEPRGLTINGYTFRLDSLLPRALSTHVIAQSEYVAYMTVTTPK